MVALNKNFSPTLDVLPEERSVAARISTVSVDRDGDVLLPSGIDVADFAKNPVVLFGHDSGRIPVGKALRITRRPDAVEATVKFASRPPEHPDAVEWVPDTIFELFKQGVLRAFSVGFIVPEGGARAASKKDVSRFGDNVRRVITRWKLLEFSVVPIPANQDALATAVSKGLLDPDSVAYHEMEQTWDFDAPRKGRIAMPARKRLVIPGETRRMTL